MTNLNINESRFAGRLTTDPELRTTGNGVAYVQFSLAVNKYSKSKDDKKVIFVNFTAWQTTAEYFAKHARKGDVVYVVGEYDISEYTDKNSSKRKTHSFTVKPGIDNLQLAGCKKFTDMAAAKKSGGGSNGTAMSEPAPPPNYGGSTDDFVDIDDGGDLPF